MSRFIDVDELLSDLIFPSNTFKQSFTDILYDAPEAEVRPIVYGEWININGIKTCNQCAAGNASAYDCFCPNCGSYMKKESEGDE